MSSALDLVVMNGPREGEVVPLRPDVPLKLGRSIKGYQLVDSLVSLNHAEISWEGDCYWIEDLESATGTFVNDVRLQEKSVVLVPGMRVRMGETVLEVRPRPKSTLFRIIGGIAALVLFLAAISQYRQNITVEYTPVVEWYQPVKQGPLGQSKRITVPTSFIRQTGIDHRGVKIDKVTDYDADGVDELWLSWKGGRRLITYDADGDWRTIADLPEDCKEKARALDESLPAECYNSISQIKTELPAACKKYGQATGFPDLDCNGATWRVIDGRYVTVSMDGVVAWMTPTEKVKNEDASKKAKKEIMDAVPKEGPPQPFLFTLSKPGQLAGFLADRGINEPIHYLVCEDALPGLKPQVLTQSGRVLALGVGCLADVDLSGPQRIGEFGELRPLMMAFSGVGYRRLVEDLAIYLGGSADDSYLNKNNKKVFTSLTTIPERRQGGVRVLFSGAELVLNPVAHEETIVSADRLMSTEFAAPPPPRAWTMTIPTAGRYDLEGCSEIDVRVTNWHCVSAKGCGESDPFMQIRNTGCGTGKPSVIPFKEGVHPYNDGALTGRVIVEAYDAGSQIDILRVRLSYSFAPETPPAAPGAAKVEGQGG